METRQSGRRRFLKTSAAITASIWLPFGTKKLFGEPAAFSKAIKIPKITLNNGIKMPMLGFGTNTLRGDVCIESVSDAISLGYRLIDTATVYGNEQFVGEGIKKSGIDRKELFVTSKLWVDDSGYDKARSAFETSIGKLGTDYLDLYLIHRPRGDVKGSWQAMEDLHKEGRIRAIGISNFLPEQIEELMSYAKVKPALNQIETHAFFQQFESYDTLKNKGIQMEAWSPLAEGRNGIFTNEVLAEIGKKYNKNNAQVSLRWHY